MKKIKWHLVGLLFYSFWVIGLDFIFLGDGFSFPLEFVILLEEFWIFYTGYSILYLLFLGPVNKKIFGLFLIIFCLIGTYFFTLFYNFVSDILYKKIEHTFIDTIYNVSQSFTHFFIYAIGYFFVVRFINKQKELQNIKQQTLVLEKKLLQSENDFLRAQINPHFLYNCLNFFYSKTFIPQPEVAEAILLLSQIMRYSLADFSTTNGLANLPDELEHIENLIKINRSRFDHTLQIKFKLEGLAAGKKITPMLLMTLVENIFKHGNLQDISSPATITCTIDESNKTIIFLTTNKKNRLMQGLSSGLGLINIEHRLHLLYNNNFKLLTTNTPTLFKVELVMPYFN